MLHAQLTTVKLSNINVFSKQFHGKIHARVKDRKSVIFNQISMINGVYYKRRHNRMNTSLHALF